MLEADPDNGILHHKLYEGYAGKEMYKEAIQQLEQAVALFGFQETTFKRSSCGKHSLLLATEEQCGNGPRS